MKKYKYIVIQILINKNLQFSNCKFIFEKHTLNGIIVKYNIINLGGNKVKNWTYKKFYYGDYEMNYSISFNEEKNMYEASLNTYDENIKDICFYDINKSVVAKKLRAWVRKIVDNGEIKNLKISSYSIYLRLPDILKSVRDTNICYHVSNNKNRKNILSNGFIPNCVSDSDVRGANKLIDSLRCGCFPKWLKRDNIIFAHPIFDNYRFCKDVYTDSDLYCIKININKCWVGSIGLSGFCLDDTELLKEDNVPEETIKEFEEERKKNARLYRKYSCSLIDFINNTKDFQRKDNYYGLDEILISHRIPRCTIEHIGYWNSEGEFFENENFKKYVKPEYKNNYKDVIDRYKNL